MNTSVTVNTDSRGVASVCLNRPDKHNAFDDEMIARLNTVFSELADDKTVRVVILRSEGKSFSAGADLNWMKRMASYSHEENLRDARLLANMLKTLNTLPKPTIALIQGAAFGGAVGLTSCCDIALASPRASFSLSEVKIGLIPATISPYVIEAMGARAARRYFLSGERFGASKALALGLISEIFEAEEFEVELQKLIDTLLLNSPQAIVQAKRLVADVARESISNELIEETCRRIADIRISPEGQEGLSAFLEKRSPTWIEE